MAGNHRPSDVKPEAGALVATRQSAVELGERLEHPLEILLRDANAGVMHDQQQIAVASSRAPTVTSPPASVNLIAFDSNWLRAWVSRRSSDRTRGRLVRQLR